MKLVASKDLYFLSAITLIEVVALFSSPKLKEFVIHALASTAYRFSMTKRRIIEKNLSRAFAGELDEDQKQRIARGALSGVWREMLSWSPSRKEAAAAREAKIRGVERLHRALKEGKGAILWESNGFGRRLLAKQILHANGFSVHQVHGPNNLGGFLTGDSSATWVRRGVVKRFFTDCERRFVAEIIDLPSSDSLAFTRTLLNLLNRNAVLCISGDGRIGQKLIPVGFLAGTTLFASGMVSLAKLSGAPLLPIFCVQEDNGASILLIEGPVHIERDAGREQRLEKSLREYASLLEGYIRRYPEFYRNWHLLDEFVDG